MTRDDPRTLVSTGWLAARLGDPGLRILDASWHLPDAGRDGRAEYGAGRIPGARFFDIDAFSDPASDLPHMAPSPEAFAERAGALGIGDADQVVAYDGAGLFSAARAWWLFRLMGKAEVAVLDGGFPKWKAEGRPVEDGPPAPARRARFAARRDGRLAADAAEVAEASARGHRAILDARSPGRFRGEEPEPRPGLRAGHVPGSRNLHYRDLLDADGTMKEEGALRAAMDAAGADLSRPVVTTCGSGVTAAILSLALERLGHDRHALYDGSWSEWGMPGGREVATGGA